MALTWTKTAPGDWTATLPSGGTVTAHARKVAADSSDDRLVVEIWATLPDGTDMPRSRHSLGLDAVATGELTLADWMDSVRERLVATAGRMVQAQGVATDLPEI